MRGRGRALANSRCCIRVRSGPELGEVKREDQKHPVRDREDELGMGDGTRSGVVMIRHHHHFEALLYQSAGSPSPFYLAASFCLSCLSASALCPERLGEIWIITPTKAYCNCSRRPTRAAPFTHPLSFAARLLLVPESVNHFSIRIVLLLSHPPQSLCFWRLHDEFQYRVGLSTSQFQEIAQNRFDC